MNGLRSYQMTPERLADLRGSLARLPEVVSFQEEPKLAAWIASLGLQREFGTINDEMARFVFNAESGLPIPREHLKSELVEYQGTIGVRLWAPGHDRLDLRFKGIRALLHPRFSFREDGSLFQCVFFPASIAAILALEGTDLVLVRQWGMNTLFGGFDPAKHYYQTNFWELENNDTLRFAKLIENRRIPFLGTHDLVAHIAGVRQEAWAGLTRTARQVREALEGYFREIRVPTIASLVIPYTVGVLLDDLAQPPNYDAPGRHILIEEGLRAIEARSIDPAEPRILTRFPAAYETVIRLARDPDWVRVRAEARTAMETLTSEIRAHSVAFGALTPAEDRKAFSSEVRKEQGWI